MKKLISCLLVIALLFTLAACGGEPDPNEGKYLGIRGEMDGIVLTMDELYPGDTYLELKRGGNAVLVLEGDKMNGKWSLKGEEFTLTVEGYDCPGTLKDGVVKFDFAGSGIILTFALEGVKVPEPTVPESASIEMGFYPLYAVDQDGEYADYESIKMIGADQTNYIICYGDGTAEIVMDNEQYFFTYTENSFIDDEGGETPYAIVDGFIELYLEGNLTFYYQKGDMEDIPEFVPTTTDGAFPAYIAEGFYGDWHGWCVIVDGTGDYEADIGEEFEMLARYAFDEDGVCTPWMAIYAEPEDNFQNLSLTYNEEDTFTYLSGELFGMEISATSHMYETFGSLALTIDLEDADGTLSIVVCLRHPNAVWDEYDYPCMPQSAIDFYADKSFEERVELYELDPTDLPSLS